MFLRNSLSLIFGRAPAPRRAPRRRPARRLRPGAARRPGAAVRHRHAGPERRFPPGRRARHLDRHGRRCRGDSRLPVQRRAPRRRLPRRPRLQPRQRVRLDPDAGGHLRHPGHRQGRLPGDRDHLRRGDRRGRLAGDRVAGRRHAHPQPARGPVQRPALVGGDGVRPVRRGGGRPGVAEHRRPGRRAGDEHQLLRGGHAAEHDLPDAARVQRRHRLRARALHDRGPARDADLPHLHRDASRPVPGATRTRTWSSTSPPGPPGSVPNPYRDRPRGARDVVLRPHAVGPQAHQRRARVSCRGARCWSSASIRYTPVPTSRNVLREIDLAGNPVRETNLAAVNAQLAALGHEIDPRLPPRRPAVARRVTRSCSA